MDRAHSKPTIHPQPCAEGEAPRDASTVEALARLKRLRLPPRIYEQARAEIEREGQAAVERLLPTDPARALQALSRPLPQKGGGAVGPTERKVVRLPLWPESMCACPSCMLRSALFGVVRRGWRKAVEGLEVAAWKGVTVRYTGWRLDQGDLDVWGAVMSLAMTSGAPLSTPLYFTESGLLRQTGRQYGKRNKDWLWRSLRRMTACAVEIDTASYRYAGSLIEEVAQDKQTRRFFVRVSPKIAALFAEGYTLNDWRTRQSLRHDTSKWLLGYVESHQASAKSPHRIGLQRLQELCGSEISETWRFRQAIKASMAELAGAGVVQDWRLTEGNALEFSRPNTVKK